MPTVLLINGFRFFFYSNENNEPAHVHVTKGNADGKIWLESVLNIAYMHGFTNAEQKNILGIVTSHYELLKKKWHEYFGK
jgi:hypothetical protein